MDGLCLPHSTRHLTRILTSPQISRNYCQEIPLPTPDGTPKNYDPEIVNIVSQISKLTILQVSDLNQLLKETLNISDAPVMAMGAMPAAASSEPKDEAELGSVKQTSFTVKVVSFNPGKKVALIKMVRQLMDGMNLVQAKNYLENLPAVVQSDCTEVVANETRANLEEAGAVVEIE